MNKLCLELIGEVSCFMDSTSVLNIIKVNKWFYGVFCKDLYNNMCLNTWFRCVKEVHGEKLSFVKKVKFDESIDTAIPYIRPVIPSSSAL